MPKFGVARSTKEVAAKVPTQSGGNQMLLTKRTFVEAQDASAMFPDDSQNLAPALVSLTPKAAAD